MCPYNDLTLCAYPLLIACWILPAAAFSQSLYTLSGLVTNPEKQAIASGEVSLLKRGDALVLKKTFIANGSFIFDTTRQENTQ